MFACTSSPNCESLTTPNQLRMYTFFIQSRLLRSLFQQTFLTGLVSPSMGCAAGQIVGTQTLLQQTAPARADVRQLACFWHPHAADAGFWQSSQRSPTHVRGYETTSHALCDGVHTASLTRHPARSCPSAWLLPSELVSDTSVQIYLYSLEKKNTRMINLAHNHAHRSMLSALNK